METINIKVIYNKIADYLDESNEYIEEVSQLFFSEMLNEVEQGNRVKIPHYGFFFLKKHNGRRSVLKNLQDKPVDDFVKLTFNACESLKREITTKFRKGTIKTFK